MTQRSDLGNKALYQIIDNQLLAAQRLVEYMMKPKSATETRGIVNATAAGGAAYTEPLHSWLWFPIYRWTRQREEALNKLVSSLNMIPKGDRKLMMKTFLNWMDDPEGTWFEDSLNTDIMYELLKLMPQYKKSDPDPRKSFPWVNMQHFYSRFKEHAEMMLAALKEEKPEVIKQQQAEALSQVPSTKELKQRLFAQANKEIPRTVVVDVPVVDKAERETVKRNLLAFLQRPKKTVKTSKIIAPIEEAIKPQVTEQPSLGVVTPRAEPPTPPPAPAPHQFRK